MKEQLRIRSPLGALYLVASAKGLTAVCWARQTVPASAATARLAQQARQQPRPIKQPLEQMKQIQQHLSQAERELNEYFSGVRQSFTVPLDVKGTEFQKRVWNQLRNIPFGKTCSYKDLAHQINNEKACRAVGSANGKNPISIIIPCHRVIAHDGTLGGYASGLENKAKLLEIERRNS